MHGLPNHITNLWHLRWVFNIQIHIQIIWKRLFCIEFWWIGTSPAFGRSHHWGSVETEGDLWLRRGFPCGWFRFSWSIRYLSSQACKLAWLKECCNGLLNNYYFCRLRVQSFRIVLWRFRTQMACNCCCATTMRASMWTLWAGFPRTLCCRQVIGETS